jgi:replication-associated recombination protein RarA
MSLEKMMEKPWFEKHRPNDIEDVVFEDNDTKETIYSFIKQGYITGNIISYGPGGTGKTTINELLARNIVKHRNHLFVLQKGVAGIADLKQFLGQHTEEGFQKIVICEEFDQVSGPVQTALKNGLMEKFMPQVAFIVTTNKIHAIDPALLQRFNIKLNFNSFNIDGVFFRMKTILDKENIRYNDDDLYLVVNNYKTRGIRELINNIQAASHEGEFKSSKIKNMSTSGMEEVFVSYIIYMTSYLLAKDNETIYNICKNPLSDENISQYWSHMTNFMKSDPSINYETIFQNLSESNELLLPLKKKVMEYYQELGKVKFGHLHLLSCIFELFTIVYSIKDGEKRLIHF